MNNFYTIDFTNGCEIQSILGFDSSILEKGVDNPKRYYVSTTCNQIVVTNGTVRHVLSVPTGYCTYHKFIEAVGVGTATITASCEEFSDSVTITVNAPLTGITLNT